MNLGPREYVIVFASSFAPCMPQTSIPASSTSGEKLWDMCRHVFCAIFKLPSADLNAISDNFPDFIQNALSTGMLATSADDSVIVGAAGSGADIAKEAIQRRDRGGRAQDEEREGSGKGKASTENERRSRNERRE